MNNLTSLRQQIEAKLQLADEKRRQTQNLAAELMSELEKRGSRFETAAAHLVQAIVRPKMSELVGCFPNARLSEGVGNRCRAMFDHNTRFPATVTFDCGVTHDEPIENLLLTTTLEIVPVFLRFEPHHQYTFSLDSIDDAEVATRIDESILQFVETYLQIEQTDQYHRDSMVVDPVCGMRIPRNLAAGQCDYQGGTYYFCADLCHQKFLEDPARFLPARGEATAWPSPASPVSAVREALKRDGEELKRLGDEIREVKDRVEHTHP